IKVGKFAENTYNEFVLGLLGLYRSGCNRFIIDLRGNLGGYLEVAIRMINEFLPKDRLIVYTEGKSSPRYEAKSTGDGNFKDIPIVILIDEWSASSSEIFAGAIQDNDRGEIIGRRSFGKGLVQQQFDFDDGSAIRLTIARYYTPSGRCIQKKYDMGTEDYNLDLFNRYKNGEFFSKDSIKHIDTTCYHTLSGRIVYGGYGIMPDIFIPKDTSFFSNFYNQLLGNSTLYQFCFRYAEQHRERLYSLKTVEELSAYLDQDKALEKLVEYASKNGIKGNTQEMKNDSKRFKNQVYAFITRNVCGDEMFYRFMFQNDEAILKSIEVLQKK
ncbi:MAG TPA: peptidase S41, partial [Porphyromonadaceae bacterium]|nr:peptidase S41 [Porphyromonadaceae bacterium]